MERIKPFKSFRARAAPTTGRRCPSIRRTTWYTSPLLQTAARPIDFLRALPTLPAGQIWASSLAAAVAVEAVRVGPEVLVVRERRVDQALPVALLRPPARRPAAFW